MLIIPMQRRNVGNNFDLRNLIEFSFGSYNVITIVTKPRLLAKSRFCHLTRVAA
jgi:hypothetical protein